MRSSLTRSRLFTFFITLTLAAWACNLPGQSVGPGDPLMTSTFTESAGEVEEAQDTDTPEPPTEEPATATPTLTPTATEEPISADLAIEDLTLDSGSNLSVKLKNNGASALEKSYFKVRIDVTGSGPSVGSSGPTSMWVTLQPGNSVSLDLGKTLDLSQGSVTVKVSFTPDDFEDPESSNNSLSKDFSSILVGPVILTVIPLTVADVELQNITNLSSPSSISVVIKNNGGSDLSNAQASVTCIIAAQPKGGGVPISYAYGINPTLNLNNGQSSTHAMGGPVDGDNYNNQITCSVDVPVFDPDESNNVKQIAYP